MGEENVMARLSAAAVARQVEMKAPVIAEWVDRGTLPGMAKAKKNQPKSPEEVQKLVVDYVTDLVVLDQWRELLAQVAEIPAKPGWSGRYWTTAMDWVVELEPKRAALLAAGGQDAEVHHLREAV
jgi:hypothetical protein